MTKTTNHIIDDPMTCQECSEKLALDNYPMAKCVNCNLLYNLSGGGVEKIEPMGKFERAMSTLVFGITSLPVIGFFAIPPMLEGNFVKAIVSLLMGGIIGVLFGATSLAMFSKFHDLGVRGKWTIPAAIVSVLSGPSLILGVAAGFVMIVLGLVVFTMGVVGFAFAEPAMTDFTMQMLDSKWGPFIILFGFVGLLMALLPRDPIGR